MIFHVPPEDPPACPRCAALESEVARLEKENALLLASVTDQVDTELAQLGAGVCDWMTLEADRDAKAALLRELAAAARDYRQRIRIYDACRTPGGNVEAQREAGERLETVLRRVDAEAGETR